MAGAEDREDVKVPYSVRLYSKALNKLVDNGLNVAFLIQQYVEKLSKTNQCPCCGQEVKKKPK